MSGLVNKVKEVLHKDHHSSTTHNANSNTASLTSGSTNHGPHDSNVANKVDPRVDSDRDNRAAHGHNTTTGVLGSTHNTNGHSSNPLSSNTHHSTTTGGTPIGLGESKLANKLDPHVGNTHTAPTHGGIGHSSNPLDSNTHHAHDSNTANRVDPRF